ncbi:hypothetical protein [Pseudorhodobacter aquimaris]|uniref:hypothetical protein n=1 Tax=Pseudorhodobacter aquimaris TaxID=687412 RepID=UPI00067BF121|nr:hypothetical protein [Pseudorhodobacter aquimaris]
MTNIIPILGNAPGLPTVPETHRHYEFGTFKERLAHTCALFEIDPPKITYEDGEPTLTEPFMQWIGDHNVNMDWLFGGSPCAMLREWSKARSLEREELKAIRALDPSARAALLKKLQDNAISE